MLRIDRLGNRVVVMTVMLVALAGLLVGVGSYLSTRGLAGEYDEAMQTELQQKGLAYGQTVQGVLSAVSASSPSALESLVAEAASNPQGLISQFSAGAEPQNTPLGFEVWTQDPSAPGGYQLLIRHDIPGGRILTAMDSEIRPLVAQTAATGEPATRTDKSDGHLHYSFLLRLTEQPNLIVVATLDASQEFAFIDAQHQRVIRDAIIFAAGSVVFVSLVGGGLSFLVSRTLTTRKRAEEALRLQGAALDATANGVVITDHNGRFTWVNPAFTRLTGYSREEAVGQKTSILKSGKQDRALYEQLWQTIVAGHFWRGELVNRRKDGSLYTEEQTITPVLDEQGAITHFIAIKQDVTERKRTEEALREQARRDPLTGVLNHATIIDELRGAIAAVGDDTTCAIAMLDVDGLKAVNDTYGHQVGDALLTSVAHAMSRRGAIVGRYGGDEFLAIIPSASRVEAEQYRDEVAAALADARVTEAETGATVSVAASIGLAIYPEDGRTAHEILDLSDSAMYSSRRQRPAGPGELSPSRTLGGERAAAMVGQIVPLLTASGPIENKLRRVAHRLSVSAGYDAVNVDVFAHASGLPSARNTFSHVPDEVVDVWQSERRRMEDEPILRHIKSTRHALIVEDPQNDERLTEAQRAVLRAAELQSAVVVPLFWEDDMIGALSVASKRKNAFTAGDIEFLTAVATQVTAIVRMATLVEELQTTSAQLTNAQEETVILLAAAAEAHDATTGQHLQHVHVLVEALARELGQSQEEARALGTAAVLHDIGKLFVPDSVLASAGSLDNADWELMKRHTTRGQEFLNGHPGFDLAAAIARHHHERWDGAGYPDGLAGERIPEAAAIVTVADAFDAMTNGRPYSRPLSLDSAITEIMDCSGAQFSPRVVEALLRLHERAALPTLREEPRKAA